MSVADTSAGSPSLPRIRTGTFVDRLQLRLLWLLGFSGGFVMIEPAPYELIALLAMVAFVATGLTVRPAHLPLFFGLLLVDIGIAIGALPVLGEEGILVWTFVSYFLSLTTLLVACVMAEDSERRFDALMAGWIWSAVAVGLIGILAYFHAIPSADSFLLYGRAKSTFKDPNVFGPFLVMPGVVVLARLTFEGRLRQIGATLVLIVLAGGLFLSFSRGAWAHFAFSVALFMVLSYLTRPTTGERMRVVVFTLLACCAVALVVAALLSVPQIDRLFEERAELLQSYDSGRFGRFGRHILGALLMLDNPLGIGPLQFSKYFPEDPHNSFLAAFAAGGWLAGTAFAAVVFTTLAVGLAAVFVPSPVQSRLIMTYATFVGVVGESYIIDVLHWRHYFLLVGMVWGLSIASRSRRRRPQGP